MAIKIKSISSGSFIEPIGILSDFDDMLRYIEESRNQSDNKLQIYNPKQGRFINWISSDEINTCISSPFEDVDASLFQTSKTVKPISSKFFEDKYKKEFIEVINRTVFEYGEDNSATLMFASMIEENKDVALKIVNDYFVDYYQNEGIIVKILSLLNDYRYEDLKPYSQTMALASLANQSDRVKSAAFNLFAHWGNKEALRLLCSVEPPQQAWIKIKYNKIRKSLEERCYMHEEYQRMVGLEKVI